MSEPFVGQIIAVGFSFAPVGWALCDGSSLAISSYSVLYNLIGTTYGGNGTTTFNLPDLRGRAAVNQGQGTGLSNYVLAESTGIEEVTLNVNQIGAHTHALSAASTATVSTPMANSVLGTPATEQIYLTTGPTVPLAGSSITPLPGGNLPHENRQPYQTINYIIALFGIYPPQS
jgi:microcystin-dependent protein